MLNRTLLSRTLLNRRLLAAVGAFSSLAACADSTTSSRQPEQFYGRWQKTDASLPPVTLSVTREGSGVVGQVWLSGVTYTLPATLDDTSIVLADPASSKLAPFVGVITAPGVMRATLRGGSDVIVELRRQ